ncbi:MAG: anti sigma factor C-terminal domain-containing protein, partial [Clostridia bacterium]|nr:anti sigma factor C-terminal domain-containing protein [Clostridia bacterium]
EMALSFSRPLTLDEMRALLPKELKPMWGAVCAFEDQAYRKNPYLARRLVGNPYLESPEGEKEFITALEALSRIPSYHSDNLKRTAVFLREHGVRYYGVVAVGSPTALQELSRNESITGAVLGIVTPPY